VRNSPRRLEVAGGDIECVIDAINRDGIFGHGLISANNKLGDQIIVPLSSSRQKLALDAGERDGFREASTHPTGYDTAVANGAGIVAVAKYLMLLAKNWCCQTGLNCRPLHYQWSALPLSYGSMPRYLKKRESAPRGPPEAGDPCHKASAGASGPDAAKRGENQRRSPAAGFHGLNSSPIRFPISSPEPAGALIGANPASAIAWRPNQPQYDIMITAGSQSPDATKQYQPSRVRCGKAAKVRFWPSVPCAVPRPARHRRAGSR
jgi:hypothetical protein